MAGETLPIVYRGSARNTLFVLAVGAGLVVAGFYAVQEPMSHMIGRGPRSIELPAPVAGWLLIPGGLAIFGLALSGIMRGCPRLELNADGIVFTHCWRGVKRMAWRDLGRVEVRENARAGLEYVALIPARGPAMLLGQLSAPADELRAVIEEAAARMKATGGGA
jgi:hypothetical protein